MNKELNAWFENYMEETSLWMTRARKKGYKLLIMVVLAMMLLFTLLFYNISEDMVKGLIGGGVLTGFLSLIIVPLLLFAIQHTYSSKRLKENIQAILEEALKTNEEQELFAREILQGHNEVIPYAKNKGHNRNGRIVLTEHFILLEHDTFFSLVPLNKLNKLYFKTYLDTTRVITTSSTKVTTAAYGIAFSMKDAFADENFCPFFFKEKQDAQFAYEALSKKLPAYTG